ncbi:MAG TPA: SpvB/TcaC N-terminal domain-containing protein [Pyrinomonadaceae bacterium]|nr:SpvB/TcaC N-terminal domain-containing protein [Pyrinomonadaceae bacterium]
MPNSSHENRNTGDGATAKSAGSAGQAVSAPSISLPKGGGAIRGIGEKFGTNPVNGTGSLTIPIACSPGRSGFGPELSLSYDSGAGNGPFGLGWTLGLPSISRKTDQGLPRYRDSEGSDDFILSGAEDLVPLLVNAGDGWVPEEIPPRIVHGRTYNIRRYRPRIEGLFALIERWTNQDDLSDDFWRSVSRDNITTWYGKSENTRIVNPADSSHIFKWLICESYDAKGNVIVYEYKRDDSQGVDLSRAHERNRNNDTRSANCYLKSIKYCNRTPYFPVLSEVPPPTALPDEWLFQVVFDYGEHDANVPLPGDSGPWSCRNDPFSSYRSGFEVRTYRLCQRALIFHHFPDEEGIGSDCLVRSTDFTYSFEDDPTSVRNPVLSFLNSVTQSGYKRQGDGYLKKSLPPVEFEYTQPEVQEEVQEVDLESLKNMPLGLDEAQYRWVDLDGEGLSGILTEQAGGWFYKRNLSPVNTHEENGETKVTAHFGALEQVALLPSLAAISDGGQQLLDLAGDGQLDLVQLDGPTPGFYERTQDEEWESFKSFKALPNLDWSDPNLKFIDLTGDGHADIMVSEHQAFTWYPSLGESGFGPGEKLRQTFDEEKGPRLVFADGAESIYLSDMSGDGLNDLLRVRNGEVSYWPNLGYGCFGAKVTMDNAPVFDSPDQFDRKRIRLADIDGSGVADIIYLKRDGVHIYFNQSGNSWSLSQKLAAFPKVDDVSSVATLDLLGNGTACLVWSSGLPGDARQSMRYLDLMGGQKPHLMRRSVNNLGAETIVRYAPSTKFYLADRLAGKPWITRIPFPVHVVESVESYDRISKNRFTTRYAYHHGYFDGVEREFRGFGMVEQWDTETFAAFTEAGELPPGDNIDASSHVPPVHTKTWFHTGAYVGRDHVSDYFAGLFDQHDRGEYYRELAWRDDDTEAQKHFLNDTILPGGLTVDEEREACRALKGLMLRQEIYADDDTAKAEDPYRVTEQNFSIKLLQACEGNRHAVFFTHPCESIVYNYERNPIDPRIAHTLTLEVDEFGNTLRNISVGYPRASVPERQPEQIEEHVTLTVNRFANRDDQPDWRHLGLPVETRTYEVVKPPAATLRLTWEELRDLTENLIPLNQVEPAPANTIPYEQWDWRRLWNPATEPGGLLNSRLRLIEHVRTLYRPDDLGIAANNILALLPLGTVQSLAVPGENYKLAFTPGLLAAVYGGRVTDAMLNEGGYLHSEGDANWWIPLGRMFYSGNSAATPAQDVDAAREHFFLPRRYRDPFHTTGASTEAVVTYDAYDLLLVESRDPLDNRLTVGERDAAGNLVVGGNNYRVLQPERTMDPNRNRTAVAFDVMGMVVGTAVMGKPEENLGDSLDGFNADLTEPTILDHLANPLTDPNSILQQASTRLVYDLGAYWRTKQETHPQPATVYTLVRETHDSDPVPPDGLKIQHSFSYSDGFSREIQKKIQAEPGPVPQRDASGEIIVDAEGNLEMTENEVTPRWVGSSWTVFNNKGKPVRQYEPFFSDRHQFEFAVRAGVSPILFYDPVERVVATSYPDHTWAKVKFESWREEIWDSTDTALVTAPESDLDVGDFFRRLPDAHYLPTWYEARAAGALGLNEQTAARTTSFQASTPTVISYDSLGRSYLTVTHNKLKYSDTPALDPPIEEFYNARVIHDLEGNRREVFDTRNRLVVRYAYDMLGNTAYEAGMEAGESWSLNDVSGKPLYAWDSRSHRFRIAYDVLRRPTNSFLIEGAGAELLIGRTVYGETSANPETNNLRNQIVQVFDQAGVITTDNYDFKSNLLHTQRQLADSYKTTLDWATAVPLAAGVYDSNNGYDALNRPTEIVTPDDSTIRLSYNEATFLEKVEANLRGIQQDGELVWTPFVTDIDYDAKGQRTLIDYGNGVRTTYTYDPRTFRLTHLLTARDAAAFPNDCPNPPLMNWPGCQAQSLHYTYNPNGDITHIDDDAQQTLYFLNQRVEPSGDFTYDALYRLLEATGREHLGQVGMAPAPHSYNDRPRVRILLSASDGNAVGRYLERYVYDDAGNLEQMIHRGSAPISPGWTRTYSHNEPSLLEPAENSNRLTSSTIGATTETYSVAGNGYDAHGNMLRMPQLQLMRWDFMDRLQMTQRQAVNPEDDEGNERQGERTWYVYDATGQRVRKVTESAAGQVMNERIYLGCFEIYRRHGVNAVERETLHIMDDKQRIALVETRTQGNEPGVPAQLIRYQFSNHLGSASLELDDQARIVSYEEYTPYGSTSYQAVASQTQTPKRYRYTGKERDEENGLYYHGARYCAPWLARWTSVDPAGSEAGLNTYEYAYDNPIRYVDPSGRQPTTNPLRFITIFGEENQSSPTTAHAQTLIRAFTDSGITDRAPTVIERTMSILVLTGGTRPPNPNYYGTPSAHFNRTIGVTGTMRPAPPGVQADTWRPTGDTGFRPELRDSLAGPQHRGSSNQIGHFLTAVDIGIQAQVRQASIDREDRFRRDHPILWALSNAGNEGMSASDYFGIERGVMIRAMIGHELIADGTGSGSNGGTGNMIGAVWRPSSADIQNFMNGRLDLIQLNTSQAGNTYQDLLLTWIGYQFGVGVQQGRFATNAEAARWLTMMLTDTNLAAVQRTDPFYQDAQTVNAMINQVRRLTAPPPPAQPAQPAQPAAP